MQTPSSPLVPLRACMLVIVASLLMPLSSAQAQSSTYTSTVTTSSIWTQTSNWTLTSGAGNSWLYPGTLTSSIVANNDIAVFAGSGGSRTLGIGFTTSGSLANFDIGAISITSAQTNAFTLGNSSSTAAGTLIFNGATVNSIADTIFSDFSTSNVTISGVTAGGVMTMALGDSTNNIIQAVAGNKMTISANITGANKMLTYYGGGSGSTKGSQLFLSGTNAFTGGMMIGKADGTQAGEIDLVTAAALPSSGTITVNTNSALVLLTNGVTYGTVGQNLSLNGLGALAKTDNGALVIEGTITATWQGNITLNNTTNVDTHGANANFVMIGTFTGTSADTLQKTGAGTMTISSANTGAWNTLITNGVLRTDPTASIGTGNLTLGESGAKNTGVRLQNNQTIGNLATTWADTTGAFTQTLSLNGSLTIKQTGNTTFGNGAVSTLVASINDSTTAGKIILDASSTGTLTLSSANLYSNGTAINGGTLVVANGTSGSALGLGNVTIGGGILASAATGATISLTGGNGVILNSGSIAPGNGSLGALTITGNLTLNGGALNYTLGTSTSSQILLSGNLNVASNVTVSLGGTVAAGHYVLMTYGSHSGAGTFNVGGSLPGGLGASFTLTGSELDLDLSSAARSLAWSTTAPATGAADGPGTWDTSTMHFWDGSAATTFSNTPGDSVTFGAGGSGGTVSLGAEITAGTITFAAVSGTSYTIAGNGHSLTIGTGVAVANSTTATISAPVVISSSEAWTAGTGSTLSVTGNVTEAGGARVLTVAGPGTIALTGTNSYSGGTIVNGATLFINTDGNLGSSSANLTFSGSAGAVQLGGDLTTSRTIGVSVAGTFDTNGHNATLSGTVTGSGALGKAGAGTLRLGTANSFGALSVTGGTLDIAGNNQTVGAVTLTGATITGTSGILSGTSFTLQSGTIATAIAGTGIVTVTGSGTVVLSGNNSYTGGTSLQGGTLSVASDTNLGNSTKAVTFNGGALATSAAFSSARTFNFGASGGTVNTTGGDLTLSGAMSGAGILTKEGTGTMTFSGSGFGNSGIQVNAGTFAIASTAGTNLTFNQTIGTNGNIDVTTAVNLNTKGGVDIDGSGQLRFLASGSSLSVHGSSPTGPSTVNVQINLNPNDVLPASSFVAAIGATSGNTLSMNVGVTGHGSLMFGSTTAGGGAGVILMNAVSDYTGNTIMNGASSLVAQLGIANALPTGTNFVFGDGINISNLGALDLNGFNQTLASLATNLTDGETAAGVVNGLSSSTSILTINGTANTVFDSSIGTTALNSNIALVLASTNTGTLDLTQTSSYTGTTTINGGTLVVDGSLVATSGVTVNTGGTLAGAGVVNAAATVSLAGGTLAMSDGSIGAVHVTADSNWSGSATVASITVDSGKTLNMSGTATVTTQIDVAGSRLVNNGTLHATVDVSAGGVVHGSGSFDTLNVGSGGSVSPGNSPGTMTSANTTWDTGGTYVWEINHLGSSFGDQTPAGTDPGWDRWDAGLLTVNSGFTVDVTSLTASNTAGMLNGFDPSTSYEWLIATRTSGDFTSDLASIGLNLTGFANSYSGTFSLAAGGVGGSELFLDYTFTAVPEPGTLLLGLLATSSFAWRLRRRSADVANSPDAAGSNGNVA